MPSSTDNGMLLTQSSKVIDKPDLLNVCPSPVADTAINMAPDAAQSGPGNVLTYSITSSSNGRLMTSSAWALIPG